MHIFFRLFVFLAVSQQVFAGSPSPDVPQGSSHWQARYACDKECRKEGFREGGVSVWLIRDNERICGYAEDRQSRPPYREPGIWFFGKLDGNRFNVKYLDSFSSSKDEPGEGYLWLDDNRLRWKTTIEPSGTHYAYIDGMNLRRSSVTHGNQSYLQSELLACINGADLLKQVYEE